MWCGNEAIESCQILHTKCSGRCCKQDMRYQLVNCRTFALKVSGSLLYKCPEWCFSPIVHKALEYLVGFHIGSTTDDSFYNTVRLCIVGTTNSRHNSKMHLRWRADAFIQFCECCSSVLCSEEFLIDLNKSAEIRRCRKVNLIHPDRHQVGPELFTVKLDIQKPVIFLGLIRDWTVNQIVAGGVIYIQQFLDCKIVSTRKH